MLVFEIDKINYFKNKKAFRFFKVLKFQAFLIQTSYKLQVLNAQNL